MSADISISVEAPRAAVRLCAPRMTITASTITAGDQLIESVNLRSLCEVHLGIIVFFFFFSFFNKALDILRWF